MTTPRCSKRIYGDSFHGYLCSRKASVTEHGQPWCKQHAPSAVQARITAREARWATKHTALTAQLEKQERAREVLREMIVFLRSGTPIHPGSELATEFLQLYGAKP